MLYQAKLFIFGSMLGLCTVYVSPALADCPDPFPDKPSGNDFRACMAEIVKLRGELEDLKRTPAGGLPIGAVVAFDIAEGCPSGNEWKPFDDATSRAIIGAGTSDTGNLAVRKFRVAGGKQEAVLNANNMPQLSFNLFYITTDDLHSSGATVMRALSSSPLPGNLHTVPFTLGGASAPLSVEMPYIPLFFCKKIK